MKIAIKVPAVRLRGPGGPAQQGVLRGRVHLPARRLGRGGRRAVRHRVREAVRGQDRGGLC